MRQGVHRQNGGDEKRDFMLQKTVTVIVRGTGRAHTVTGNDTCTLSHRFEINDDPVERVISRRKYK